MTTNGVAQMMTLSKEQLLELQKIMNPYFAQVQQLEAQANAVRKTINDIAGAYLAGLGMPTDMSIDLATGGISPPALVAK